VRSPAVIAFVTADADRSLVRLSGAMSVDEVLGAVRGLGYPVQLLDESHAADT
jgi:hypothetical protein